MVVVVEVTLSLSSFGSELELEEVQDPAVGLHDVLFENWVSFDDFDARCAMYLFKCKDVGLVHDQLLDVCGFEQEVLNFLWENESSISSFEDLNVSGRTAEVQDVEISSIDDVDYQESIGIDVFKEELAIAE